MLKVGDAWSYGKSSSNSRTHLLQVSEKCPECGHLEAYSKEMQVRLLVPVAFGLTNVAMRVQLRSADEGSTILYTVGTQSIAFHFPLLT